MSTLYCQEFLERFGPAGREACACGREHRLAAELLLIAPGALQRLPELVAERLGRKARVWVLSDENTEAAAGRACTALLGGAQLSSTVLPAQPRPRTTHVMAEGLAREAAVGRPELILAVGSGTISDLSKMVSTTLDVPNWCVPTAASVDAYTSATSAVKAEGEAISIPVRATQIVIADLEVLRAAPGVMYLAGLGDLLSKYFAYLDWRVAAMVTGEYYCPESAELGLRSARRAIDAARGPEADALLCLMDAALSSGLAMQAVGHSRPASSMEHTVAHIWDMGHAAAAAAHDLHGLLVGLSSSFLAECLPPLYAGLRGRRVDVEARRAALHADSGRPLAVPPGLEGFRAMIERAAAGELAPRIPQAEQLQRLEAAREQIADLAEPLLADLRACVDVLREVGHPLRLADFGFGGETALLPMRHVRLLRDRYSAFHLAHQLGVEAELLRCLEAAVRARG